METDAGEYFWSNQWNRVICLQFIWNPGSAVLGLAEHASIALEADMMKAVLERHQPGLGLDLGSPWLDGRWSFKEPDQRQ